MRGADYFSLLISLLRFGSGLDVLCVLVEPRVRTVAFAIFA